jgi:hypothetical protein
MVWQNICVYVCGVVLCVCVSVWERERESETSTLKSKRESRGNS